MAPEYLIKIINLQGQTYSEAGVFGVLIIYALDNETL